MLTIIALLYNFDLNKRKNDIITDINMTAGSEKVDRKNIHVYMLSVEPGESNAIGETIAPIKLNGNIKQNIILIIIFPFFSLSTSFKIWPSFLSICLFLLLDFLSSFTPLIIAITIATTTAIQINLISTDIKLIAVELICIQIPPVIQKVFS